MQPHYPFLGKAGKSLSHRGYHRDQKENSSEDPSVWNRLHQGDVAKESVWAAYQENLDIVLEQVSDIIENISGLHAVSADHGNLIGDRTYPIPVRGYGHPHSTHVQPLIKVPWATTQTGDRRNIKSDSPQSNGEEEGPSVVEDQLRALGYRS